MMTKRGAENSSLHEIPQKKRKRHVSVWDAERVHTAAAPRACHSTLTGEGRRKRPRSCEDSEQYQRTGERGNKLKNAIRRVDDELCVSGKFRGTNAGRMCEMTSEESASELKAETEATLHHVSDNKVMHLNNNDYLCEFNSFRFWRSPLPALDLSLLDDLPITRDLKVALSPKDSTEEMET